MTPDASFDSPPVYSPRRIARSEFISLRGLRHHLLRWDGGAASAPTPERPLLVMLHGWMDVGASFQFVIDAMQENRPILAMDWRGFGLSDAGGSDSYWFPDYLGDLDALLDAVSPNLPVDLLGHSMGGNIVMTYAGVRPQRIRRLINLEGFGLPDTQASAAPDRLVTWLDELKQAPQLKPYASLSDVAARLSKTNPRLSADKAAWLAPRWSTQVTLPDGSQEWRILADPAHKKINPALYRREEAMACWARITAPTLWVEGHDTDMMRWFGKRYPRSDFEERLALVQSLRRVGLSDAGHMLHHDQPDALAQALEDFLG